MTPTRPQPEAAPNDGDATRDLGRRRFLAFGAGLGATAIAGCSTGTGPGGADDGSTSGADDGSTSDEADGGAAAAGTFRLLISDQPVAIDEFDELDVSFDRARIFRAGGDDGEDDETAEAATGTGTDGDAGEEGEPTESATSTGTEAETATGTSTATPTGTETEPEGEEPDDDGQGGFFVADLGGATVDLTQVVGDKAMGVFEGELAEGRYAKVELYAEDVEGVVDGEPADVKIPSGKLQIVKPFEVVAGETLDFVFDINVVRKGGTGSYNLLPVISESGVAGRDVEVTEVGGGDSDGADGTGTEEDEAEVAETSDGPGDGGDGGPPDDAGGDP